MQGGGEKKFYASAIMDGELTLEGLTKSIEKISTVSGADIRAVLFAMVDVLTDSLANGRSVKLGDLGNLRVCISSEARTAQDEVNSSCIKNSRVIFTPGKQIKSMLKELFL